MKKEKYNVAVVGATGAVGDAMLEVLDEFKFPIAELRLLASAKSAGKEIIFQHKKYQVQELTEDSFKDIDIALFSAGGAISEQFAPHAVEAGAIVIDNTSAFRMDKKVPLVVPEVNPRAIAAYKEKGIIANPNCSTIQMVLALKPIYDAVGIKRIVVSTYQATSGAGKEAMQELREQTQGFVQGKESVAEIFPHPIAFNCLPQIDVFLDNGYTKEEMKMIKETKKILEDSSIEVTATCVRVAVFHGHSESVNIETKKFISANEARELMANFPGVQIIDNPSQSQYPMNIYCEKKNEVFVGRVRQDESISNGLNMWIVADNIRKGAATNAVQIAQKLIEDYI